MDLRARRALTLTALLTASLTLLITVANPASAGPPPLPPPPESHAGASGQIVTVTVSGSGYKGGSAGSTGEKLAVSVPAPCWRIESQTGKEYYEFITSGVTGGHDGKFEKPRPGYEMYKDDDKGHWYGGGCSFANWPDQDDVVGYNTFADQFFATQPAVYVPATQAPPVPPVPPELLRQVAVKNLTLPDPKLDWNPKRPQNQGTLVNFETWFWLDNSPRTLQVKAAAGGNEATVTVKFAGMDITAPGEAPVSCVGPGTPYTHVAHTTCSLAFSRASIALGATATPVTVKTRWTGTWGANGIDQGLLTPQPTAPTTITSIAVDEIQTVVTHAQ